jgi:deoxyribodipyrimidine photolyase-like uncharacterized protein
MATIKLLPDQLFAKNFFPKEVKYYYIEIPERYEKENFNVLKIVYLRETIKNYKTEIGLQEKYSDNYIAFEHPEEPEELENASKTIPAPNFLLTNKESKLLYEKTKTKTGWQTRFYKELRKRFNILMCNEKPENGKWTYDADNRKFYDGKQNWKNIYDKPIKADMVERCVFYDKPKIVFPVTRSDALARFHQFLEFNLENFGKYQDAMVDNEQIMFHSGISMSLNCGLLTPDYIIEETLKYKTNTNIASVEGFIRQILGWREFVRAAWVAETREKWFSYNALNFQNRLGQEWYSSNYKIQNELVAKTVKDAWNYGDFKLYDFKRNTPNRCVRMVFKLFFGCISLGNGIKCIRHGNIR